MKNTQKNLMLTVIFSLASGQTLQADWQEKARETYAKAGKKAHEGYDYLKTAPKRVKEKAKSAWKGFDKNTQEAIKNAAIVAGAIAGTAVVAGAGYAGYSTMQTDGKPESTWKWPDDPRQNEAAFSYLIEELSRPGYKGIEEAQEGYINQRFPNLNQKEKDQILKAIQDIEKAH